MTYEEMLAAPSLLPSLQPLPSQRIKVSVRDASTRQAPIMTPVILHRARMFAEHFHFAGKDFPSVRGIYLDIYDRYANFAILTQLHDRLDHAHSASQGITLTFNWTFEAQDCDFLKEARRALRGYLEHELDECIYMDNQRPFDPHKDDFKDIFFFWAGDEAKP
jgi:hypothetical protein